MSVYDREWYKKDAEQRRRRQEGADTMWDEVEPSRQARRKRGSETAASTPERSKPTKKVIPTVCPHCDRTIQLSVPVSQLDSYSFTCPSCGKTTTVRKTTITDKKVPILFFAIGLPAAFYLFMYLLSKMFI